nr:hypothetical protein [Craspedacusta sowerbii]
MDTKITHPNLKNLSYEKIRESLTQFKKSSEDFVLLSIYITTTSRVRFQVYSSNLIKLTHKQIKTLVPRIHQRFEKTMRCYQIQLPIENLTFELINVPKKYHATQRKNHDARRWNPHN